MQGIAELSSGFNDRQSACLASRANTPDVFAIPKDSFGLSTFQPARRLAEKRPRRRTAQHCGIVSSWYNPETEIELVANFRVARQEESTLFLPELWADTIICVSPCL
jgi:hypothetical protein